MSMRAVKPAGDVPSWDAPSPVRELMYAMVIGEPVAAFEPDAEVDAVGLVVAVVAVDEPPLEHPAATSGNPSAATRSTPVIVRLLNIVLPLVSMDGW
jgi:hypothetical protein